jgi:hypothetical protein
MIFIRLHDITSHETIALQNEEVKSMALETSAKRNQYFRGLSAPLCDGNWHTNTRFRSCITPTHANTWTVPRISEPPHLSTVTQMDIKPTVRIISRGSVALTAFCHARPTRTRLEPYVSTRHPECWFSFHTSKNPFLSNTGSLWVIDKQFEA